MDTAEFTVHKTEERKIGEWRTGLEPDGWELQ